MPKSLVNCKVFSLDLIIAFKVHTDTARQSLSLFLSLLKWEKVLSTSAVL